MSGTLIIRNDVIWMPSTGMVAWVLEQLASKTQSVSPQLATALLDPSKGHDWGFYDLTSLEASQFQALEQAMKRVYEEELAKGIQAVARPNSYFFYMRLLSFFKALLRTDSRISEDTGAIGIFLLSKDIQWTAPLWIYDLVLENLAAFLQTPRFPPTKELPDHSERNHNNREITKDLPQQLLLARSIHSQTSCNLKQLSNDQLSFLTSAAEFLFTSYKETYGSVYAPLITKDLIPQLKSVTNHLINNMEIRGHSIKFKDDYGDTIPGNLGDIILD